MVNMVEAAGDDGEQQPWYKPILYFSDHGVYSNHLSVLQVDVKQTAGDDGEHNIESDVSDVFGAIWEMISSHRGVNIQFEPQ